MLAYNDIHIEKFISSLCELECLFRVTKGKMRRLNKK